MIEKIKKYWKNKTTKNEQTETKQMSEAEQAQKILIGDQIVKTREVVFEQADGEWVSSPNVINGEWIDIDAAYEMELMKQHKRNKIGIIVVNVISVIAIIVILAIAFS